MSGSDGRDEFWLLNNAERTGETAGNFSVCRCLVINKYMNITREMRYSMGGRFAASSETTNTEVYVCVEVNKGENTRG